MLILTRRVNERIIIGNHEIDVTILGIKGHQVRLGLTADPKIAIHREEIFERIEEERADKPPQN